MQHAEHHVLARQLSCPWAPNSQRAALRPNGHSAPKRCLRRRHNAPECHRTGHLRASCNHPSAGEASTPPALRQQCHLLRSCALPCLHQRTLSGPASPSLQAAKKPPHKRTLCLPEPRRRQLAPCSRWAAPTLTAPRLLVTSARLSASLPATTRQLQRIRTLCGRAALSFPVSPFILACCLP